MKVVGSFIALLFALAGCRTDQAGALQHDTYAVYSAALDSFSLGRDTTLLVGMRTHPMPLAPIASIAPALIDGVVGDAAVGNALVTAYDAANTAAQPLCDCFVAGPRVRLVAHEVRPGVPGPILLSGVGFDTSRTRALVEIAQTCGPLCGSSILYLMVRRDGQWSVSRRLLTGTS